MRITRQQSTLSRRMGRLITAVALITISLFAFSLTGLSLELRTEAQALIEQSFATSFDSNSSNAVFIQTRSQKPGPRVEQQSPTNERSRQACQAGQKGDTSAIPLLISMLGDDTKTELSRCWDTGNWSPALDTFKHPSPGEQAAIALASMGRPAFQPLTEQLNSGNPTVRRNAAWAIGELTNMSPGQRSSAVPQLNMLLGDADEWVRMAAARALGELRDRRATPHLAQLLSDGDWRVREMAAWSLSELKDDRAVNALGNALLSDAHIEVRQRAAEALGEIKSSEGLPFLKQALNDPESVVNRKVAWAISEIEDSE